MVQKIPAPQLQALFTAILLRHGMTEERAARCAEIFTANSLDGVYTHGVNRFPRFVQYIQKGFIDVAAEPRLQHAFGGLEQWDGCLGPGPLNAVAATDRVLELASSHGIGCVALAHTNHWMRGGYYGWQAARKGFVFIGWTNTIPNLPAWQAVDSRLGNNPLVVALPFEGEAIVLDMAMSQFSFGALEQAALKGEELPVPGGFDAQGGITHDPSVILATRRPLPIGYWKGAGLSLLLDLLATVLSAGLSTAELGKKEAEYGVSQVYIALDLSRLGHRPAIAAAIRAIIDDYRASTPAEGSAGITYPGERVLQTRQRNSREGIPVLQQVWEELEALSAGHNCK
ncbi:3-dehydro-L-gulonate 2-dehydrogenase [Paraflavisolibacter sp. H34]|uniref:3-dehydro-L-gulonate 2-dehydrogenase n=1 Tax=Huijunlia imazamoxiresistens TaxID=3127457 RepID=UPI00301A215A